eukprot:TRINITY_DN15894_c0_g1_i1.p1 TRINITY_DN15894_c0_g1~~TRINITY_DN15894_c0_g1_i1.p1  ORF type:complete len:140 (+),score=40.04 TRINITY_DN15894_c0_g1_i1:39-458(+)
MTRSMQVLGALKKGLAKKAKNKKPAKKPEPVEGEKVVENKSVKKQVVKKVKRKAPKECADVGSCSDDGVDDIPTAEGAKETLSLLKKLPKSVLAHANPEWLAMLSATTGEKEALTVPEDEEETPSKPVKRSIKKRKKAS